MRYVRPFDVRETFGTSWPGHHAQLLSHLESALIVARHTDEGRCGPDLHYHRSDKLYYVLQGTMGLLLGDQTHVVEAETLAYVPAGMAHRNWNDGSGAQSHVELVVPSPAPGAVLDIPVDSPVDVPAEHRAKRSGYVRPVDPGSLTEALPGMWTQSLADPESGSEGAVVFYVEVGGGDAGPAMHIHVFDQYYLVLEGQLTVEVALQTHTVDAGSLVLLPAGVPHRQYNSGTVTEKHLAIVAPAWEPGRPVDRKVVFADQAVSSDPVGATARG